MVRQKQYPVFSKGLHAVHHIAYDKLVEVLYGLDLVLMAAGMSCLVRRLYVQVDKIHSFQRIYCRIGLASIVSVNPACHPGNFKDLEASIYAKTFCQIHRRDEPTPETVFFME